MQVFVINLEGSRDRRAGMRAQLDALGVRYSFFRAIEAEGAREFFDDYDEREHLANTGRTASPGEVACFASHRCLWRQCVAAGKPIVVLEDDAQVLAAFADAFVELPRLIDRYGFIRLQDNGRSRHVRVRPVESAGAFTVLYYASCPFGSMAYALNPSVAAAFLEKSRVLTGPVDLFMRRFWVHGQPLFALSPYTVRGGAFSDSTTIESRVKPKVPLRLHAARFVNKLDAAIARARFNFWYDPIRLAARPHAACDAGDG